MKRIRSKPISGPAPGARMLSASRCTALLRQQGFGHLVLARHAHVDAVPIRFVVVENWLYFAANTRLRAAVGHNAWVAVAIAVETGRGWTSVVAYGACYATDRTGSAESDAEALLGIRELRSVPRGRRPLPASVVFRVYLEALRGEAIPWPRDAAYRRRRGAGDSVSRMPDSAAKR